MCVGIPMRVVESCGASAWAHGRNGRALVDMQLVGPQPIGTWVLAFLGAAREVLMPDEASRIDAALDAVDAALAGGTIDVDACFADLAGREPTLPEHLQPAHRPKG